MRSLVPNSAFLSNKEISQYDNVAWILPSSTRKDRLGVYKILPAGQPDYIHVDIIHTTEGTERCTAAIYGNKAYVIHYTFKKHDA